MTRKQTWGESATVENKASGRVCDNERAVSRCDETVQRIPIGPMVLRRSRGKANNLRPSCRLRQVGRQGAKASHFPAEARIRPQR